MPLTACLDVYVGRRGGLALLAIACNDGTHNLPAYKTVMAVIECLLSQLC